jgi:signal transduction histidine kinase
LPPQVQIALYRIAQEALNNVAKHASASQATVALRSTPKQVVLAIGDDGCGFDPDIIRPDQLGLGTMRERADKIGAMLEVESQPADGTWVVVAWPAKKERRSGG